MMEESKPEAVVQNGRLSRLSVSQISRFDETERGGCARKWWFRYVGKLPDPPSTAQDFGIAGHKRLEKYFLSEPVELTRLELDAIKHLPAPGPGVKPELELEFLSLLEIPFKGSIDLFDASRLTIFDYKYQGDPRKYKAPTVQTWGYLEEIRRKLQATSNLTFKFVGLKKVDENEPAKTVVSPFSFSPQEVIDGWGKYEGVVSEMVQVAAAPSAKEVKANRNSCFAFGKNSPCPYLNVCNSCDTEEVLVSFMDKLTAMKADISSGKLSESIETQPAAVSLPDVSLLPPDAPPPQTAQDLNEAPDSSPSSAPKKPKKAAPTFQSQRVVASFSYKINLERALGPAHKYESAETGLTVEDFSGADPDELLTKVRNRVLSQTEAFIESKRGK